MPKYPIEEYKPMELIDIARGRTTLYVPPHSFIVLPLPKLIYDGLRKWLDAKDVLELATDADGNLWITNRTMIERTRRPETSGGPLNVEP